MYEQEERSIEKNNEAVASSVTQLQNNRKGDSEFVDNRSKTVVQRSAQQVANNSLQMKEAAPLQMKTDGHSALPIQKQENNTGLPDHLKSGIEHLSGHLMDDVKVHYHSDKPAQLQAHAYAQGSDIHLAPGQEKHLPHEAWHVVQQKQGRVQPTKQLKSASVHINDDTGLEKEADVMGAKAAQLSSVNVTQSSLQKREAGLHIAQRVLKDANDTEGKPPKDVIMDYIGSHAKYKALNSEEHKDKLESLISSITDNEDVTYYIPGKSEGDLGAALISIDKPLEEALEAVNRAREPDYVPESNQDDGAIKSSDDSGQQSPAQDSSAKDFENISSKDNKNPWVQYNLVTKKIKVTDGGKKVDGYNTIAQTCSVMSIKWLKEGSLTFNDLSDEEQQKAAAIIIKNDSLELQLDWVSKNIPPGNSYVVYTAVHFYAAKKVANNEFTIYDSNHASVTKCDEANFRGFISGKDILPDIQFESSEKDSNKMDIKSDLAESVGSKGLLDIENRHSELIGDSEDSDKIKDLDEARKAQMGFEKDLITTNADKKKEYDEHLKKYALKFTGGLSIAEGLFDRLKEKVPDADYEQFKLAISIPLMQFEGAYYHINHFIQLKLANEIKLDNYRANKGLLGTFTYSTEEEKSYSKNIKESEEQIKHWEPKINTILNDLTVEAKKYVYSIVPEPVEEQIKNRIEQGIQKVDLDPVRNLQVFVDKQKWLTSTLNKMLEEGVERLMDADSREDKKNTLLGMMKFKNSIQRYIQGSLDTYIQMKQNNAAEAIKNQNSLAKVELIHKSFGLAFGVLTGAFGIWEHFIKKHSPSPGVELNTTNLPSVGVTRTSVNSNTWDITASGQLGLNATMTGGLGRAETAVDTLAVHTISSGLNNLLFSVIKAYYGKQEPVPAEQAKYTLLLEQASLHMTQEMSLAESTYRNALETVKTFAAIK